MEATRKRAADAEDSLEYKRSKTTPDPPSEYETLVRSLKTNSFDASINGDITIVTFADACSPCCDCDSYVVSHWDVKCADCGVVVSESSDFVELVRDKFGIHWQFPTNDRLAAKAFKYYVGNKLRMEERRTDRGDVDSIYVYNESTGLWENGSAALDKLLRDLGPARMGDYWGSVSKSQALFKMLPSELAPKSFIEDGLDASFDYLHFKDGIFHCATGTFVRGFDPKIVT
jgi:hypothetical protein